MNETNEAVRDILRRTRAKQARRAVSRKLALYHQSLVDALSADTNSFFERVMEQVKRDISTHHQERMFTSHKNH
jgi:regulator of sigma D